VTTGDLALDLWLHAHGPFIAAAIVGLGALVTALPGLLDRMREDER
jgi:hypothetical protein